eukprot:IDg1650t1
MPAQTSSPSQLFKKRSMTSPVLSLWAFFSVDSAMVKVVVSVACVFSSGKAVWEFVCWVDSSASTRCAFIDP